MKNSLWLMLSVMMVLALVLSACAAPTEEAPAAEEAPAEEPAQEEVAVEEEVAEEPEATDKLVIYSPNSDNLLNSTIPVFEEMYGVEVEVISAGTGEVFKRLQGEKNNPYADVAYGGAYATYMINEDLFQDYVSENNSNVMEAFQNTTGYISPYVLDGSVILVMDVLGVIQILKELELSNLKETVSK